MTDAQRTAMYFDHITRDWDLTYSHERHMQALARRATARGHLFIFGVAS